MQVIRCNLIDLVLSIQPFYLPCFIYPVNKCPFINKQLMVEEPSLEDISEDLRELPSAVFFVDH